MALGDWFKRKGQEMTAENVEAKAHEVGAEIAEKESVIATMRAELSTKVLDGDHLAAHRIEHDEHELNALKLTKTELEAKARELRAREADEVVRKAWEDSDAEGTALIEQSRVVEGILDGLAPELVKLIDCEGRHRKSIPIKASDFNPGAFLKRLPMSVAFRIQLKTNDALQINPAVNSYQIEKGRFADLVALAQERVAMGRKGRPTEDAKAA